MREDFEKKWEERKMRWESRCQHRNGRGQVWTGVFILLIGIAALLNASIANFPPWIFSWQMLLIALGVFIGLRHNFKGAAWFILILIGSIFLFNEWYPEFFYRKYLWPLALIAFGIIFIARSGKRSFAPSTEKKNDNPDEPGLKNEGSVTNDDFVNSTSIFGGCKKNIISKNFRGGDLINIFGGSELDLTQADMSEPAIIEITTIFGGTKFIVPSNWNIKSEAVMIFGGVDDKRKMQPSSVAPEKTLILKGTVIFGGIDIKSY